MFTTYNACFPSFRGELSFEVSSVVKPDWLVSVSLSIRCREHENIELAFFTHTQTKPQSQHHPKAHNIYGKFQDSSSF
jgi:hypothetical protein